MESYCPYPKQFEANVASQILIYLHSYYVHATFISILPVWQICFIAKDRSNYALHAVGETSTIIQVNLKKNIQILPK